MNRHISEQFEIELDEVRKRLMTMGGLVEQQLHDACEAFLKHDDQLAKEVPRRDGRINQMEVELDDLCVHIMARRQPAASDLRTIISIMKAGTDLERVGDEASRIARAAQVISALEFPDDQYADVRALQATVSAMLREALDAFTRLDASAATRIIAADRAVDEGYAKIVQDSMTSMRSQTPDTIAHNLNTIWAARSLERIGDHAKNISEDVVYLVEGNDIRHARDMAGSRQGTP